MPLTIDGQANSITSSTAGVNIPATVDTLSVGPSGSYMIANSSGVGIGTLTPQDKLTVLGKIQVQQDSGSSNRIVLRGQPGSSYRWNIDNYSSSNNFRIFREDDVTNANGLEMVKVDTSGNLQLSQANTSVLNSSGRKILNQTGSILQVVQTIKTDTFYSATAETWYDVTGMSASITPSSTSSRILVCVNLGKVCGLNNNTFRVTRNGTVANVGDAAGSRQQAQFGDSNQGRDSNHTGSLAYTYIDSPATTSSITYQLSVRAEVISSQGFGLNRTYNDTDGTSGYNSRCASTIVLMEIAG
jgi:hypothetical protein